MFHVGKFFNSLKINKITGRVHAGIWHGRAKQRAKHFVLWNYNLGSFGNISVLALRQQKGWNSTLTGIQLGQWAESCMLLQMIPKASPSIQPLGKNSLGTYDFHRLTADVGHDNARASVTLYCCWTQLVFQWQRPMNLGHSYIMLRITSPSQCDAMLKKYTVYLTPGHYLIDWWVL